MQILTLRYGDLITYLMVGFLLYIVDLPGFGYLRFDIPALIVATFAFYRHRGISLSVVFLMGLMQDAVSLAPLGQHAIGLVLLAYLCQKFRDRIKIQSMPMQLPWMFIFLLGVKFVHIWVSALEIGQVPSLNSLISVIGTVLLWPFVLSLITLHVGGRQADREALL